MVCMTWSDGPSKSKENKLWNSSLNWNFFYDILTIDWLVINKINNFDEKPFKRMLNPYCTC